MLLSVVWDVDPAIFTIPEIHIGNLSLFGNEVRWYGLMWAIGFMVGYEVIRRIFRNDGYKDDVADNFFRYMLIGTVIGARLGHCFFYDWDYYSKHLIEVLYVHQGGLSSHGGAIGIFTVMFYFSRKVVKQSFYWMMDRVVIPTAICGCCIRFGNLMNSEIYGIPTDLPWGFIFVRDGQTVPCHPTQIYEMLYCIVAFITTLYMYWKTNAKQREGFIFGVFLVIVFLSRILIEFIKNNQSDFEQDMLFNMGQWLSLPLVIWGVYLIYKSLNKKEKVKA